MQRKEYKEQLTNFLNGAHNGDYIPLQQNLNSTFTQDEEAQKYQILITPIDNAKNH